MTHSAINGNIVAANTMQSSIIELIDSLFCDINPIPIKTAMKLLHYDIGYLRGPLCDMPTEKLMRLQSTIKKYEYLIAKENTDNLI